MNYKGILLDLDNTLYDYDTPHVEVLEETLEMFRKRVGLSIEDAHILFDRAKKANHKQLALTASSHSRLLYFQKMLEYVGAFDVKFALELDTYYWHLFMDRIKPEPYVLEFLQEIPVPKCIVTDFTAEAQYKKLIKLGIVPWVDHLVTSEEAGVEKPHPFIYMLALNKLGLKPEECVMIGDSYKKDCLGASALGIDSIYYKGDMEKQDVSKGIYVLSNFHHIAHWME